MKLTKVEASSMQEALRKIRTTLGNDAMIVGTRTLRRGGVLGVGGREVVEVYVTDNRPRPAAAPASAPARASVQDALAVEGEEAAAGPNGEHAAALRALLAARSGQSCAGQTGSGQIGAAPTGRHPTAGNREEIERLSQALGDLRQEIRDLVREKDEAPDHPFLRDAYQLLVDRDVEPKLASRIAGQLAGLPLPMGLPDAARVRAVVASQLKKLFLPNVPPPAAGSPRVVVLLGPTGVGKTTTIAKLAARAKLVGGQRVALVTLDTFRIAAVDQLQKYAQIIGIPLAVASDPIEFRAAVGTFAKEDIQSVFVDSAGRSQRDELKMTELKEFLQVLPGAEVHLVLSTTTHPRTLKSIAERFGKVGFHRVILTKLDEGASLGPLLETLVAIGKPVSFLTDGQNVPDDLMTSDPDRLADLVLRQHQQGG